jgi:hypothetical protein
MLREWFLLNQFLPAAQRTLHGPEIVYQRLTKQVVDQIRIADEALKKKERIMDLFTVTAKRVSTFLDMLAVPMTVERVRVCVALTL